MAYLVSAIASGVRETDACEREERISPHLILGFFDSVFLVGWLLLMLADWR